MKVCTKCGGEKDDESFYARADGKGLRSVCKICCRFASRINYDKISTQPGFYEKERERNRIKAQKYGYSTLTKQNRQRYPWLRNPIYYKLHALLGLTPEQEVHHWSYNEQDLDDVFILDRMDHRNAHTELTLCMQRLIFKTREGKYLDTKEKHWAYILPLLSKQTYVYEDTAVKIGSVV